MLIRFPRFRRPSWMLRSTPSPEWQRAFTILPRLVRIEVSHGRTELALLLPGWHETRVSNQHARRLWREVGTPDRPREMILLGAPQPESSADAIGEALDRLDRDA